MNNDINEYVRKIFQQNFIEYYVIFGKNGLLYAQRNYIQLVLNPIERDLKTGKKDIDIKARLEEYLKTQFTEEQRKEFNDLKQYVMNILNESKVNLVRLRFNSDIYDHIVGQIVAEIRLQNSKSGVVLNDLIIRNYNRICLEYYDLICEKVIQTMYEKYVKIRLINEYDIDDENFINDIQTVYIKYTKGLLKNKDSLKDEFKKDIDILYDKYKNLKKNIGVSEEKLTKDMQAIYKYIKAPMKKEFGIEDENLIKSVVNLMFVREKREFLSKVRTIISSRTLISRKVSDYINEYISKNSTMVSEENKVEVKDKKSVLSQNIASVLPPSVQMPRIRNQVSTIGYIMKYIKENVIDVVDDKTLLVAARDIDKYFREKEKFSTKKILSSECRDLIIYNYHRWVFKHQSVECPGVVNDLPKQGNKRKSSTAIIAMVLAAVMAFGAGKITKNVKDSKAMDMVEGMYGFNYSSGSVMDNKVNDLVNDYNELMYMYDDENYATLVFYEAYRDNLSDRDMDILFHRVVNGMLESGRYRYLTDDYSECVCYLDFIYDRLYDMGFTSIKEDKYQNALRAYKMFNYPNLYGVAGSFSEENRAIIDEVKDKYVEYCEKYKLELGYKLIEDRDDFFTSDGVRRSH